MAEIYFEKAKQIANSLTIQFNGTSKGSFNGSSGVTINITPSAIGAAASSHSHSWSSITSKPSTFTPTSHSHAWADISGKPSTFTPSSHTHDDRYYTESEINTKLNERKRLYRKQGNKTRIGYLEKVQKGKKGMKLLHDSVSFL